MVTETLMKLRVAELDFPGEKFFAPQNWENGPKMYKNGIIWIGH